MPSRPGTEGPARLRRLTAADIPQVVELHVRLFGTSSGRRYLTRAFYPTMLDPSSTGGGYVQVAQDEIVGFIVGALDTGAWHRTLARTRTFECVLAAGGLSLRRGAFQGAAGQLRALLSGMSRRTGALIFYLGVEQAHQGRGLAGGLVGAFLDGCRAHGLSHCWTRTPAANTGADAFYLRAGFRREPAGAGATDGRIYYVHDLNAS